MKKTKKYILLAAMMVPLFYTPVQAATYDTFDKNEKKSIFGMDMLDGFGLSSDPNSKYQKVSRLIKSKELERAQVRLTLLLKETPNDVNLYNLQALVNVFQGDKAKARLSYKKAIQLNADDLTANLGLSGLALESGDLAQAEKLANQVLSRDEKNINAIIIRAKTAVIDGNEKEAEAFLLRSYKGVRGDIGKEVKVLSVLGQMYAMQKSPEKILDLGNDIVSRYPDDYRALSVLAGAQVANKQNRLAEKTLRKIILLKKNDINHRLMLAKVLSNEPERSQDMLALLDKVLSLNPSNSKAIVIKANYLLKQKRFKEAMEHAQAVEKKFPGSSLGKQLQGDVFLSEKKAEQALESYRRSYAIEPVSRVMNSMVSILRYQGKQDKAIALLKQELKKKVNIIEVHLTLATIYNQLNKNDLVAQHYNAVLKLQQKNLIALNNLAWFYKEKKQLDKAEALAKEAYAIAPKVLPIVDTYGYILVKQGKIKKGLEVLEGMAEEATEAVGLQTHIAEAYLLSGNKKQALEVMNRLVKNAHNEKDKQAAMVYLDKLSEK